MCDSTHHNGPVAVESEVKIWLFAISSMAILLAQFWCKMFWKLDIIFSIYYGTFWYVESHMDNELEATKMSWKLEIQITT